MKPKRTQDLPARRTRRGFTLIELMVVIVIVAVLASLGFMLSRHAKLAAAKATSVSNMRNIGIAVMAWGSERGGEPMYYSNGTADYPHESTPNSNSTFAPGNPARALFDVRSPEASYIGEPGLFFSPLVESDIPSLGEFRPDRCNERNIWGTYAWFHPFVPVNKRNGRQRAAMGTSFSPGRVNPRIEGQFLMSESYAFRSPKFDKSIFHALMIDGSVRHVGNSEEEWKKWKEGE